MAMTAVALAGGFERGEERISLTSHIPLYTLVALRSQRMGKTVVLKIVWGGPCWRETRAGVFWGLPGPFFYAPKNPKKVPEPAGMTAAVKTVIRRVD